MTYRVPTMQEVRDTPWNGFNVVSTFSGCGGSCLGYRMAGFRVLWANEFIEAAQETYRANHPSSILDGRDIRSVKGSEILSAIHMAEGDIDVFDGSPPCSAFSTAGSREDGWGKVKSYSDTKQRVDDLFYEYIRLIGELRPRTFVAENVSGLVKGTAKGYFKRIISQMKAHGYRVRAAVLDAQWLGVPQGRQRLIFIGVREDLGVEPRHPTPLQTRFSLRDAIPWIRDPSALVRECPDDAPAIERFAIGAAWATVPPGGGASERYFSLVLPDERRPCPTITQTAGVAGAASVVHPFEARKFSCLELRRICGFPDDFVLTGDYRRRVERLGRSVPPLMMMQIANAVRGILVEARDA